MFILPLDDVHSAGLLRIIGRLPVRFDPQAAIQDGQTFPQLRPVVHVRVTAILDLAVSHHTAASNSPTISGSGGLRIVPKRVISAETSSPFL